MSIVFIMFLKNQNNFINMLVLGLTKVAEVDLWSMT